MDCWSKSINEIYFIHPLQAHIFMVFITLVRKTTKSRPKPAFCNEIIDSQSIKILKTNP